MTGMTLKNPANRNGLSTTATLWTLSGIVLAACGGGGGSAGPGRGVFPTGLASIAEDDDILPVSSGMITDLMLPRHVARNDQPYKFTTDLAVTDATIENQPTGFRADGSRDVMAFGVPVANDAPMLDAGEWVRIVSMSGTNRAATDSWDGAYNAEGPRGAEFNPFNSDNLSVKELYIKLTPVHGLDTTDASWRTMMDQDDVHKIYFDADVFRNGNKYQGNIKGTVLVTPQDGDSGARGDVDLYLRADLNEDGMNGEGDVTQQYTLSVNGFNADTFRAIDNDELSGQNKNLLGYMVGGDLGNNYLRWIGQSRDGGAGPNGALAVAPDENGNGGDTIYADFYINIPEGWNVRLIWWLDDVLGDMSTYTREAGHTRDNLPGFVDGTLDFNYAGLIANPEVVFTAPTAQTTDAMISDNTIGYVVDNPMIGGVSMNGNNYVANNGDFISGFSDISDPSNQFAPPIAGRYYVQVVAYDATPIGTGDGQITMQQRIDTAYFGFDNLHEIDVQTADFDQALFDAFYGSGVTPPEIA